MFLSSTYIKEMPRVIEVSLEAYLRKIENVSDSDLVKVLAYGCKSSTKGG